MKQDARNTAYRLHGSIQQLHCGARKVIKRRVTVASTARLIDAVSVNYEACECVAQRIASQKIPEDREEIPSLDIPGPLVSNFFLFLVAICHRTSSLNQKPLIGTVNGVTKRGWDYLLERFYEVVRSNLNLLAPSNWIRLSAKDIKHIFGNRLIEAEGRAALIRDLGDRMTASGWMSADEMYKHCDGRIAIGYPNLLEMLSEFQAYSDPVRKKSLYFLSVMRNNSGWKYRDDESLGPPVDYHEVRGHLRLGTVQVNDWTLLQKIREGQPVTRDEDIVLRQAVYSAIVMISERSGIRNASQLHYLFWNVFRSVCLRKNPQCFHLNQTCDLPVRYRHLAKYRNYERCPFAGVCRSAGVADPLPEHTINTDYY
jgi:hypothetical protein